MDRVAHRRRIDCRRAGLASTAPSRRGSRWCTTSCSTCAAPSACSSSSARCGPTPTSTPPSTTSAGPRGGSRDRDVHSSFLQRLRPSARTFRALLPLYPAAIESFDLSGYDLVVSSSSAWAHAVLCDERSVHVSYCHNPFRYAWNDRDADARAPAQPGHPRVPARRVPPLAPVGLDRRAADRPLHRQLAHDAGADPRLLRSRRRRSSTRRSTPAASRPGPVGDHYAIVSELMPHKQIDVAIEAFNQLAPAADRGRRRARRRAGCSAHGRADDPRSPAGSRTRRWPRSLQGARALIVTSVEEFGIAAVESQAAGRPVIARRGGGALETIVDGRHRVLLVRRSRRARAKRCASSTTRAIDPRRVRRATRRGSTPRASGAGCSPRSTAGARGRRTPAPAERQPLASHAAGRGAPARDAHR